MDANDENAFKDMRLIFSYNDVNDDHDAQRNVYKRWLLKRNVHDRKWIEMLMMGSWSYLKDIVCFLLNLQAVEPDRAG